MNRPKRFRYLFDSLFLPGCGLYATNRWLIKPHVHSGFFHDWFNDTLLIPCALPPLLWLHRRLGLRSHDFQPGWGEVLAHLVGWSILFEAIGPRIMRTTGDPWDVAAYAGGGFLATLWWHRREEVKIPGPARFDWLARHYRWLEFVLAGGKLQKCRLAHLAKLPAPVEVAFFGEGNGRCLVEVARAFPQARITCFDLSRQMLIRAERRLESHGLKSDRIRFVQTDVLEWAPVPQTYDLIITHFFLDCFTPEQLAEVIRRIAVAAAPRARWLIADFCEPERGWSRWRANLILEAMYATFQLGTGLPADQLTPPDEGLRQNGFVLRERLHFDWGLLHSDFWEKTR